MRRIISTRTIHDPNISKIWIWLEESDPIFLKHLEELYEEFNILDQIAGEIYVETYEVENDNEIEALDKVRFEYDDKFIDYCYKWVERVRGDGYKVLLEECGTLIIIFVEVNPLELFIIEVYLGEGAEDLPQMKFHIMVFDRPTPFFVKLLTYCNPEIRFTSSPSYELLHIFEGGNFSVKIQKLHQ